MHRSSSDATHPGVSLGERDLERQVPVAENIDILLVAEEVLLRRALSRLLGAEPGMRVVGEADDLPDAEAMLATMSPHIVVVDLDGRPGSEQIVADLMGLVGAARVLALTSVADPQAHARVITAGAAGIVDKRHEPEVLCKAIRKVHAGELWLARYDMAAVVSGIVRLKSEDAQEAAKIATLTKRELEII